jgi:hypothetical protein
MRNHLLSHSLRYFLSALHIIGNRKAFFCATGLDVHRLPE